MGISKIWGKFKRRHPERLKLLTGLITVFCGFLLANIAQGLWLKWHRWTTEKNYISSLVKDLKKDIHEINAVRAKRENRENQLDSLIYLLDQEDLKKNAGKIYQLVAATDEYESFVRTDRTMQELKFTGNIHLLKDIVADSLIAYDNFVVGEINWNNLTESDRIDNYKKNRFGFFDVNSIKVMYPDDPLIQNYKNDSLAFQSYTKNSLNEIRGMLFQLRQISKTCTHSGDDAIIRINHLIQLIDSCYHIK